MKKTLIATLIGLMGIGMVSCGKAGSNGGDNDSTVVTVSPEAAVDSELTAIGVAIDGAMNSITIVNEHGDTLSFSYPDLAPEKRYSWSTGDSITIKFVLIDDEPIVTELTSAAQQQ